jgi:hypothetical protein
MRDLLDRLAFADVDARDLLAAEPTEEELRLVESRREELACASDWPFDEAAPWLHVRMFLGALAHARELHRTRGVGDDVSWATLSDLGRHAAIDRQLHGSRGLRNARWISLHFTGGIYELGRLQFEPRGRELSIHIPATGPLAPDVCTESLARATAFFEQREAFCTSWLLDPALADYLPGDSNIVRFQRRFRLVDPGQEAGDDVLRFVFRRLDAELDELPQRTSLERAIVAHIRAGARWRSPTGRLAL